MPDPSRVPRPWIDAYPPGVPPTYRYPAVSLGRFLDDAARDFPTGVATRYGRADLTYAELRALVDRIAGGLADLGVARGTTVATALPNLPATVAVAFATWRLGAVLVPVDPQLPVADTQRRLTATGAAVVFATPDQIDALTSEASASLRTVVVTDASDWGRRGRVRRALDRFRRRRLRASTAEEITVLALADLVTAATPWTPDPRIADGAGPAVIAYTSGTTGPSRGAVLTHANLVANAFQARLWVPDIQAGRERLLAATSFANVYGLTLGMLTGVLSAATLLLPTGDDADSLVASLAGDRATLFPAVPQQLQAIVEHPDTVKADLTSLRACVSGAAPLAAALAQRFQEVTGGARIREGYGLTEASPLTHANPVYGRAPQGRIGLPVTDTVSIVVDPDDPTRMLESGEVGELAVAGPQVMSAYHDDPVATAAALRDGWLLTGDLVTADQGGSFQFVDRRHGSAHAAGAHLDEARWRPRDGHGKVAPRRALGDVEEGP